MQIEPSCTYRAPAATEPYEASRLFRLGSPMIDFCTGTEFRETHMDRRRRIKQHTWAGNSPDAWRSCAGNLFAAASVLREHREITNAWIVHPPELMLVGMAIECLLKAVWVNRGNAFTQDGKFLASSGTEDTLNLWDAQTFDFVRSFTIGKCYDNMYIRGAVGISDSEKSTLNLLGAIL